MNSIKSSISVINRSLLSKKSRIQNGNIKLNTLAAVNSKQNANNKKLNRIDSVNISEKLKLVDYLDPSKTTKSKNPIMDRVTNKELKYYDPPYLNRDAPFPNYELLNINIKGYDFNALDYFYKNVESVCKILGINVIETYKMPARKYQIKTYQPFSTILDKEVNLYKYHRIVKIGGLKSTIAPLLFETIQLNLPEGVTINISIPNAEEEEFRYVPDIEVQELKKKLDEIDNSKSMPVDTKAPVKTASKPAATPQSSVNSIQAKK